MAAVVNKRYTFRPVSYRTNDRHISSPGGTTGGSFAIAAIIAPSAGGLGRRGASTAGGYKRGWRRASHLGRYQDNRDDGSPTIATAVALETDQYSGSRANCVVDVCSGSFGLSATVAVNPDG